MLFIYLKKVYDRVDLGMLFEGKDIVMNLCKGDVSSY